MRFVFAIFRYYPLFMIPFAVVVAELAWFMKRKGNKIHFAYMGFAIVLVLTSGLWIYFRGDLYADRWIRQLIYDMQ